MPRKRLRLLVPIDFSPASQKALRAARELASRTGASLTIVHVRPHSDIRAAVVEDRGDLFKGKVGTLRKAIARHYQERLDSFAARKRGETLKLLSAKRNPSSSLVLEARKGYDFVVMGSRGRGRVAAPLLGSTVQEMLARCPVPVLVIGPR